MEGSLREELYPDSLNLSKLDLDSTRDPQGTTRDDGLWDDSDHDVDENSDLDREWQRRRDQFHTIGYRDGLIAGKESAAQDGFNIGFKESVSDGYKWGLVRGITSAFALLPDGLKEKLVEREEMRTEFRKLYESAHSLSTTDALKLFHDSIVSNNLAEQDAKFGGGRSDDQNRLERYYGELKSLLESSEIEVKLL